VFDVPSANDTITIVDGRSTTGQPIIAEESMEPGMPSEQDISSKKIAAGICGILLGAFGVHKFILGMTTPGVIMLLITLLTCGIGSAATSIIGIVEGIIYLTKSNDEFYREYMVGKKEWF
jgi:TM2 domain-containing membrane protein YozV